MNLCDNAQPRADAKLVQRIRAQADFRLRGLLHA